MVDVTVINLIRNEIARLNNTIQHLTLSNVSNDIISEGYRSRVYVAITALEKAKTMLESIVEEQEKL
jgi:hypothetical protein